MAVVKMQRCGTAKGSCKGILDYISRNGEVEQSLMYGKDCSIESPSMALQDFLEVKELYDNQGGRQYYHLELSFEKEEYVTPEKAHQIGVEWIERNKDLEGFQVVMATHTDKEHIHNHIVINSVSLEDGHKLQMGRGLNNTLKNWKELSNEICKEHNFKQIDIEGKEIKLEHEVRYTKKELELGEGSWKNQMRNSLNSAIEITKEQAIENRTQDIEFLFYKFKKELEIQGVQVVRETKNSITFQDLEGNKARGSKLDSYFKSSENIKSALEVEITRELDKNFKRDMQEEILQNKEQERIKDLEQSFDKDIEDIKARNLEERRARQHLKKLEQEQAEREERERELEKQREIQREKERRWDRMREEELEREERERERARRRDRDRDKDYDLEL